MASALLQVGGGLLESVSQVAVLAGAVLLGGMVVALVAFAYRHLAGDGVEWPDDDVAAPDEGVRAGSDDDEWDYY